MTSRQVGRSLVAAASDLDEATRTRVFARIAGPIGVAARDVRSSTRDLRATWAAAVRLPVPPGLRAIHPSWIESVLIELPAEARGAIVGQGGDRAAVWLARWACAEFPTLVPEPDDAIAAALNRTPDELYAWIRAVGADQLAVAAHAAGGEMLAAIGRRYPAVALAADRIAKPPRAGHTGSTRAAIARCRTLLTGGELDDAAFASLGARCLAPHLCDPFHRRALVLRMPRAIGEPLEHELVAHAATPLDQVPTWAAVAP